MLIGKMNNYELEKKGQISMFVILAIILVLVGVIYFIFSQTSIFETPQSKSQEQISEIVRFCVEQNLDNAVKVLQFKGGRINSEPYEDQVEVETFDFDVYSWDRIISLDEMQLELETEVEEKAVSCLLTNLKDLNELYDIQGFSKETFDLDVTIQEDQVSTIVNMPLSVKLKSGDESWEYSSLNLEMPSALYTNYELAKAIYLEHQNNYVFEDLVLDQIAVAKDYSDPTASIPTVGIDFSCDTPVWRASEIQYSILSMNEHNFKFLYFNDTKSIDRRFEGYSDEIVDYYSKAYVKDLEYLNEEVDFSDSEVRVVIPKKYTRTQDSVYLTNFRTFLVNGDEKEFVSARNMKFGGKIPIPCMKTYSFFYDLDYDFLVEIESFENSKLEIFRLPIRIQIESSEPKRRAELSQSIISEDVQFTRTPEIVCSDENSIYDVDIYTQQVSSGGLSPLYGTEVSMRCSGVVCTDLGEMTTQATNSQAFVKAKLPYCSRAQIIAQKEGYFQLDTIQKIETLGFEGSCGESFLEIDELDFNGKVPYLDVCLVKKNILNFDVSSSTLFNIDTTQTLINPTGELIVQFENVDLDFNSFGYVDFTSGDSNLEIEVLDVDSMNFNISVMYYENDELVSYYVFENQNVQDLKYKEQFSVAVPIKDSELDGIEDYNKIQSAYLNGYLDVNFGYQFD